MAMQNIGDGERIIPNRSLGRESFFLDYFLWSFGFYKMPFACF